MAQRWTRDPDTGVMYLYLRERQEDAIQTVEVSDDILLDFTGEGELVGIEFLNDKVIPRFIKERAEPPDAVRSMPAITRADEHES